jgi:hypothetical protein
MAPRVAWRKVIIGVSGGDRPRGSSTPTTRQRDAAPGGSTPFPAIRPGLENAADEEGRRDLGWRLVEGCGAAIRVGRNGLRPRGGARLRAPATPTPGAESRQEDAQDNGIVITSWRGTSTPASPAALPGRAERHLTLTAQLDARQPHHCDGRARSSCRRTRTCSFTRSTPTGSSFRPGLFPRDMAGDRPENGRPMVNPEASAPSPSRSPARAARTTGRP